ncbi:MAG: LysM peptidoglycan-binding domain-containing protein [Chloroflexi bacterium]|nr:LysM peptidoglycan-binding domain-containing protein [Chloroflexota bacterium]
MAHDQRSKFNLLVVCTLLLVLILSPVSATHAATADRPLAEVSPWELIAAMNSLRVANGLPALLEDPIINAVAQSTAQIMADTLASWHIGNVSGRIQAAGYGGGGRVIATENFAVGSDSVTLDNIMFNYWNDPDHMLPAVTPSYCHIGAGSAKASNGMTYYVLQAASVAGQPCGSASYPSNPSNPASPGSPSVPSVPQIIIPVEKVEPNADGNYVHIVKSGQSFWSIAVAYKVTGDQIRSWNNLPQSYILQPGDKLTILGPNAQNYATPPPANQVILATPEPDGRIVHTVKVFQNLEIISNAYSVTVNDLLRLNNWQIDWPLQINQKILVKAPHWTPTPTERPLTPIERLTPAADGRYYHHVKEGQNVGWIAGYYGISVDELLAWNSLTKLSIIYPGDKLLLNVTPPATATPVPTPTLTPEPATATPVLTTASLTSQPSITMPTTEIAPDMIAADETTIHLTSTDPFLPWLWGLLVVALLLVGGYIFINERNKKRKGKNE